MVPQTTRMEGEKPLFPLAGGIMAGFCAPVARRAAISIDWARPEPPA